MHTDEPQLGTAPLETVIQALTLEEKVKLLSSNGYVQREKLGDFMALGHPTFAVPRLGIPSVVFSDGPAGIHFPAEVKDEKHATSFATATVIASSWNREMAYTIGQALGHEAKEYGIDLLLAPGMNAHRHPLGGRNFEYFSEDPLISGLMAASFVNGVQSNGVGACLKHFVANEGETYRNLMQTYVSVRALREIYLKSFEIALEHAKPWSVMTSLNFLNGVYTSESTELLDTILRQEWGFDGFVMTDWFGGKDAVAQMVAGNDLLTPGDSDKTLTPSKENQEAMILKALRSGELSESVIDRNVERFLRAVLKAPSFKGYQSSNSPDLKRNAAIARETATEGMILLKNEEQALPLDGGVGNIALFGNAAYDLFSGGTGSGAVWVAYDNPMEEGLRKAGYRLDDELKETYRKHIDEYARAHPKKDHVTELWHPTPPAPEMSVDPRVLKRLAGESDIAILSLGRVSGENMDREREDFPLTAEEKALIEAVSAAFRAQGKQVVMVLNIGAMIEIASWRDLVDAILVPWLPGQEGGNAITDILTGVVSPSGRLATSWPTTLEQEPSDGNFPGTLYPDKAEPGFMTYDYIPGEVTYEEGIYTGYRYFDSFDVKPAYPFGFGLSYTTFAYGDVELSNCEFKGVLDVGVTITNTGQHPGKEVVQLYVTAPEGGLEKPKKELRAFDKTRLLKPGESQKVTFSLTTSDLASFDPTESAWIAEAGDYSVQLCAHASEVILSKSFSLKERVIVKTANRVLLPNVAIKELSRESDQA